MEVRTNCNSEGRCYGHGTELDGKENQDMLKAEMEEVRKREKTQKQIFDFWLKQWWCFL